MTLENRMQILETLVIATDGIHDLSRLFADEYRADIERIREVLERYTKSVMILGEEENILAP